MASLPEVILSLRVAIEETETAMCHEYGMRWWKSETPEKKKKKRGREARSHGVVHAWAGRKTESRFGRQGRGEGTRPREIASDGAGHAGSGWPKSWQGGRGRQPARGAELTPLAASLHWARSRAIESRPTRSAGPALGVSASGLFSALEPSFLSRGGRGSAAISSLPDQSGHDPMIWKTNPIRTEPMARAIGGRLSSSRRGW